MTTVMCMRSRSLVFCCAGGLRWRSLVFCCVVQININEEVEDSMCDHIQAIYLSLAFLRALTDRKSCSNSRS